MITIFRKEINKEEKPEKSRQKLIKEYREKFSNLYVSASRGIIDQVIDPQETRLHVIRSMETLISKRSMRPRPRIKHGNIPV